MRVLPAQLLGFDPAHYPVGKLTYDLRRLRLRGIIERIRRDHAHGPAKPIRTRIAFDRLESEIQVCCEKERLAT